MFVCAGPDDTMAAAAEVLAELAEPSANPVVEPTAGGCLFSAPFTTF